jgi:hypothetical protein
MTDTKDKGVGMVGQPVTHEASVPTPRKPQPHTALEKFDAQFENDEGVTVLAKIGRYGIDYVAQRTLRKPPQR